MDGTDITFFAYAWMLGWTALLAVAGYWLGRSFREVEKVVGPLSMAVIALIIIAYIWRQLTWRRRHPD